jgi:ornithine cyclodeaminase/alanine dehydrogenase-like protein (mu-crystallin family)
MSKASPLVLEETAVRRHLDLDALIPAMSKALQAYSAGQVEQPVRTVLDIAGRGFYASMPAYVRGAEQILGAKLVSIFPGNAERQLHTHLATIVLADAATGATLAVMDGRYITEMRTAAVSAATIDSLARRDAKTVGIFGSGVQARSHVEMLRRVRDWRSIAAWSPNPERLERFAVESNIRAASTPQEAASADVVVTATSATAPILQDDWIAPGTHVIAVGACRPNHAEVDPALVARARLFVDSREAALRESGDILRPLQAGLFSPDHIQAELGAVLSGAAPGRGNASDVTLFKSLGLAVEDITAAALVYASTR